MSELAIKVVVDAAQVAPAMNATASAVSSAAQKMAEQLKVAGLSAKDAASAMKNLGFASAESSAALQRVGLVSQQAAAQVQSVSASTANVDRAMALASARMAGFATGTGMLGTALGRVAASSSTLGPLLSAAFPVLAAVALVDIISKIPGLFKEIIDGIAGWTAESKKAYAELFSSNLQMLTEETRLKIQVEALNEIGAKGAEKWALAVKNNTDAAKAWAQTSAELLGMQRSLNEQVKQLTLAPATVPGAQFVADVMAKATTNVTQLRSELEEVNKALEVANRAQQELQQVGGPKAQKDRDSATRDQAQKDLENWAREQERQGREAEEAAVRRGEAERRAIEEKERLDDEDARHSQEMARKDLEAWQKSLEAKTALIREAGKSQLDQIRANADLAERDTASKSGRGAGDPAIAQQAFEAYREEIATIQELITVEDALQAKLKATGAAIDDPKVEESMRRQAEMMQQMNAAWDRYAAKVQQVTREQQRQVQQMVNAVSADLSRGVVSWVNGQETFGRAMSRVWTQAVDTLISQLIRAGVQMIANIALQKSLLDSTKLSDAAAAARHTWTAVAAIPYVGPFLAPEAAAAAFAGVMAFERGGMVPGSGPVPIIAHGGERVLNAAETRDYNGGSGNTVHVHYNPTVNGGATASSKDMLDRHGKTLTRSLQRMMRKMNR
jgi:hypothetical protein